MKTAPPLPTDNADEKKVDRVYTHLRRLIRDMQLKPGTPLQKDRIAAELGVSRAPVSEAIARLAEELLVDVYPRHGSFVAPIRTQTLRECIFIRTALEVETVRRITPSVDEAMLKTLRDNVAAQERALAARDMSRLLQLDDDFHGTLLSSTGFRRATHLSMAARVPMDRPLQFGSLIRERAQSTVVEHRRILDAIALRDAEFAAAAMRSHLDQSSQAFEKVLTELETRVAGNDPSAGPGRDPEA